MGALRQRHLEPALRIRQTIGAGAHVARRRGDLRGCQRATRGGVPKLFRGSARPGDRSEEAPSKASRSCGAREAQSRAPPGRREGAHRDRAGLLLFPHPADAVLPPRQVDALVTRPTSVGSRWSWRWRTACSSCHHAQPANDGFATRCTDHPERRCLKGGLGAPERSRLDAAPGWKSGSWPLWRERRRRRPGRRPHRRAARARRGEAAANRAPASGCGAAGGDAPAAGGSLDAVPGVGPNPRRVPGELEEVLVGRMSVSGRERGPAAAARSVAARGVSPACAPRSRSRSARCSRTAAAGAVVATRGAVTGVNGVGKTTTIGKLAAHAAAGRRVARGRRHLPGRRHRAAGGLGRPGGADLVRYDRRFDPSAVVSTA
jgi:hypothetical protein